MNNAELSCWSILTTKKDICRFISTNEYSIVHQTVLCMLWDNDDPCYKTSMVALCVRLQTLNYMCFRSRSRPRKMSAQEYNHLLFDGLLETQQEFKDLIREKKPLTSYSQCRLDTLWIKLTRIRELWCNMIAMPYDRPFLPELIFAFEYVISLLT